MQTMGKIDKSLSLHHILPRSRWGNSDEENLELIRNTTHRAIHTLFTNQMIWEQLITMVWLNEKALREDVKKRLLETFTSLDVEDPYLRYKRPIIK